MVTATYTAAAALADVIKHYEVLFTAQGLPFHPEMYGAAAVIRGDVPGCSLSIQVRTGSPGIAVRVSATERPIIPKVTEQDIRRRCPRCGGPHG
jgi:hypothetical protein